MLVYCRINCISGDMNTFGRVRVDGVKKVDGRYLCRLSKYSENRPMQISVKLFDEINEAGREFWFTIKKSSWQNQRLRIPTLQDRVVVNLDPMKGKFFTEDWNK